MSSTEVVAVGGDRREVIAAAALRATPEQVRAEVAALSELMRAALIETQHYGTIPGTPRPTLYKAGAEWLLKWAGYGHRLEPVEIERDDKGAKYGATYRCTVHLAGAPDAVVATCDGYAGYDESRWRASGWNTILKMAQKRALVGAALQACGASGIFTQDLDDADPLPHERAVTQAEGRAVSAAIVEPKGEAADTARAALKDWMQGEGISFTKPMTVGQLTQIEAKWAELYTPEPDGDPPAPPAEAVPPAPAEDSGASEEPKPEAAELETCSECQKLIPFDASRLRDDVSGQVWGECCMDGPTSPARTPEPGPHSA